MGRMSDQAHGPGLSAVEAAELIEALGFLDDWLAGPDQELLAESLHRFLGGQGYDLATLRADLSRLAFLLGSDGERLFGPGSDPA